MPVSGLVLADASIKLAYEHTMYWTPPCAPENYFGMTLHDKIEAMENKL